jgi:hypothetical protein
MIGSAEPEQLGGSVGANYFRALGVPPILGRDFKASTTGPTDRMSSIEQRALAPVCR